MQHGCHSVGPSTDYLVCDECDYCAQTDPDFTSWEDHWANHRVAIDAIENDLCIRGGRWAMRHDAHLSVLNGG